MIVTSRDPSVIAGRPDWKRFDVPGMTEDEALSLLRRFAPPDDNDLSEDETRAGKEIVKMLGYLPLAIDQTACFIHQFVRGFREYVEKFEELKKEAIERMPEGTLWHYQRNNQSENWFTTYENSLSGLDKDDKEAATSFLTLSACFGDAAVHETFFEQYYLRYYCSEGCDDSLDANANMDISNRPAWLSRLGGGKSGNRRQWDSIKYRDWIGHLGNKSLVQFQHCQQQAESGGFDYSLHPVIREWLLVRITKSEEDHHTSVAVAIVAAFTRNENMIHSLFLQTRMDLLAHINKFIASNPPCLYESDHSTSSDGTVTATSSEPIALFLAHFCREFSRLATAKALLQQALKVRERAGIPESDPRNAKILIELGRAYADNAEHSVAESYFAKVLKHSQVLEPSTRCQALICHGLAMLCQGKIRTAHPYVEQALKEANEINKGGERLQVQATLTMAQLKGSRGCTGEADKLCEEAYKKAMISLGPTDNLTFEAGLATIRAHVYRGEPEKAKQIVESTLSQAEKHNGLDHRVALNALMSLGSIYGAQRSHAKARECFELSRARAHALFGGTPGDVDIGLLIGHTYMAEKKYEKASEHFRTELQRCQGRKGYEMVFVHATGSLLQVHVKQKQFLRALPYMGNFFRHFPFAFFVRMNKVPVLVVVAGLAYLLDSGLRGNVLGIALLCVLVGAGFLM